MNFFYFSNITIPTEKETPLVKFVFESDVIDLQGKTNVSFMQKKKKKHYFSHIPLPQIFSEIYAISLFMPYKSKEFEWMELCTKHLFD